jgi:hypothetical protein
MRFLKHLKEAVQVVSPKDLPDWVRKILKQKGMRKDITVNVASKVDIGGNWHDANVRDVYVYEKGKIKNIHGIGGMGPWDSKTERIAKTGFTDKLTIDRMVLVTNTYPKNAELYVHPDAMIKAIGMEERGDDLSKEEILTLRIVQGLKSFARRREAQEFGIDFDSMAEQLKNKGYLMKNGAISKKGKNFMLAKYSKDDIFGLAKKLGIKGRW